MADFRVALELATILNASGASVHLTRIADHRLSREGSSNTDELHARIDYFEHHNPHFFLSVHHNAGPETASGHTALYKHNATDDTLYEQLATSVNEALVTAVPGPKLKLIKGSYHILRETEIPGTISEAGFMTHKAFDDLCNGKDYPNREAAAIAKGATEYWTRHKVALIALRERLSKERAAKPRDPKTVTATALNADFQTLMNDRLTAIAPGTTYDPAKVGVYLDKYKSLVVTDPQATFQITATWDGKSIRLAGETSKRTDHDQFIDVLVAMKLYSLTNEVKLPKPEK